MELNEFLDKYSQDDLEWRAHSDDERKVFFDQIMTRVMRVVDMHRNDGEECVACTKRIGGMSRVIAWPCSTVRILMGVEE